MKRLIYGVLLVFSVLFPIAGLAQYGDLSVDGGEAVGKAAHIVIDGETIIRVHGINAYTAEQRAKAIQKRIVDVASDTTIDLSTIKLVEDSIRMKIVVGEALVMNIYMSDAVQEGLDKRILAEFAKDKIEKAIVAYRINRSRSVVIRKVSIVLASTIGWVLALIGLMVGLRKLQAFLMARMKSRVDIVADKSSQLVKAQQFWQVYNGLFKMVKYALVFAMAAFYLNSVLAILPWTAGFGAYVFNLFLEPLKELGTNFLNYLPSLAFLVVIVMVTRYALKMLRLIFNGIAHGDILINGFDVDWAMPTFKIVRLLVIVFAIVVAYPYIPGSETNAFKGISVFVGVLFSLGSSSFISNLIAGYTLTYRKAFRVGDRIKVDNHVGYVEEQKVFVTRLRSLKNEDIIIPNSVMLNSNIINYTSKSKEKGIIIHTTVGIGYETPWRQVDAMLMEAAARTALLQKEPEPYVLKQSLGDFAVNYEINGYCTDPHNINKCYTELHQHILDVFNENNVQIMTPNYVADPEVPKVVPNDQWEVPLVPKQGDA
jgi:small-conductance mechanosensitive channel